MGRRKALLILELLLTLPWVTKFTLMASMISSWWLESANEHIPLLLDAASSKCGEGQWK